VIEVVGIGAAGWDSLPAAEQALVLAARRLLGGARHLDLLPDVPGQERLCWPRDLRGELPRLVEGHEERPVVVLASGDPLLAGVGSTLVELFGTEVVRVHPAVSSVALAAARLGWAAGTYAVVRLRGQDVDLVRRELYDGRRLLVLSRDAGTAAQVAAVLVEEGYGTSTVTVLGDLGAPTESRTDTVARSWSGRAPDLNIVSVQCVAGEGSAAASLAPGLPDEAFDHDGQLTKRDLRASALAHLLPRPGELLWDVGAGAGGVAIDWLRVDPSLRAVAIERDGVRAGRLLANATRHGVAPELELTVGEAPACLGGLPAPSAVFVGGGLGEPGLLEACWERLRPGGRLVANAVTLAGEAALLAFHARNGGRLVRLALSRAEPLGGEVAWRPALPVTQLAVRKPCVAES
jgi:precorrin-6Y C5,15-methyltransferase (decarboxylating)